VEQFLTLPLCEAYQYSKASHTSCPAGELEIPDFHKILKKKYFRSRTNRLTHVRRLSDSVLLSASCAIMLDSCDAKLAHQAVVTLDEIYAFVYRS
jgi:hypothetical protein